MNELMEQMTELLEAARQQGIADAIAHVEKWRTGLGDDLDGQYFDGIDDALITIKEL